MTTTTIARPAGSPTVVRFKEASTTACESGWVETSASLNGLGTIEDSQRWFTFQEIVTVPLDVEKSTGLDGAPSAVSKDQVAAVIASVVAAEAGGNLKRALRFAFEALDQQMLQGHWDQIQRLMAAFLARPCSTDLGVGVLRFCSSARDRIPAWPSLISMATKRCKEDGSDYRIVLRGLI